jgi:hypothetical protein
MNRNPLNRRGLAVVPCTAVILIAGIVACRDALLPSRTDAPMTAVSQASDSRVKLRDRNKHDWVGVAHNNAMSEFRHEIRRPGVLTRNACQYLLRFVSSDLRLPVHARGYGQRQREAAIAGARTTKGCRAQVASASGVSSGSERASIALQEGELSDAATQRTREILAAVEGATDRYDLATRLSAVLDSSSVLSETEQAVVGAAVSTAQNSFEYWEDELPAFQRDIVNEYAECSGSASQEEARSDCLESGAAEIRSPGLRDGRVILQLVGQPPRAECSLKTHFKRLAGADVVGAIVGGVRGLIGGPQGVLASAFASGAYASLGVFIYSTWELHWCAMQQQ